MASCARTSTPPSPLFLWFAVTDFAQGTEYTDVEARAVAADNAQAVPVFISGAIGVIAGINGFYDPTQEKGLDGRLLLCKRGDASVLMEHFGGRWLVKSMRDKGTGNCYARVTGSCTPESCTSRQWKLWDGKGWSEAPGVTIVAEAEVSGPLPLFYTFFMRTHFHTTES
jgi:hypothetical protein